MLDRLPPMDGQYGDFVVYHRHRIWWALSDSRCAGGVPWFGVS